MSERGSLSSFERRQALLEWIESEGRISVEQVCARFGVSEATSRRDLNVLARMGKARRVHGGAIRVKSAHPEEPFLQREFKNSEEKQRIGCAAAALVKEGETVFLASGSTTLAVARQLLGRRNLTVITNSLPVIELMKDEESISLLAVGGLLRKSELSFIGHIAEQAISELRADKVFIGTHAIDLENGLTSDYLPEVMVDRAILRIGREVILVADHTKFGLVAPAFVAPISSIHVVVTDVKTPREYLDRLAERGVKVVVA